MADDVADHRDGAAVGLDDDVVPVPAHVQVADGRPVADDQLEVVGLRRLGKQAALQLLRDRLLPAEQPGVVQRQRAATGHLDRQGELGVGVRRPVADVEQRERAEGLPRKGGRCARERGAVGASATAGTGPGPGHDHRRRHLLVLEVSD
jgi:hypothetical protein